MRRRIKKAGMNMEFDREYDAKGLMCPMPIVKLAQEIKKMESGQVLKLICDDIGSKDDVPAWASRTGNEFLGMEEENGTYVYYVKKK